MTRRFIQLWSLDDGQDVAEYAIMMAVVLVLVTGTVKLIGGNTGNVFSATASAISQ